MIKSYFNDLLKLNIITGKILTSLLKKGVKKL